MRAFSKGNRSLYISLARKVRLRKVITEIYDGVKCVSCHSYKYAWQLTNRTAEFPAVLVAQDERWCDCIWCAVPWIGNPSCTLVSRIYTATMPTNNRKMQIDFFGLGWFAWVLLQNRPCYYRYYLRSLFIYCAIFHGSKSRRHLHEPPSTCVSDFAEGSLS